MPTGLALDFALICANNHHNPTMPTNWTLSTEAAAREQFWLTGPADPMQQAQKAGVLHLNKSLRAILMPQSAMPIGPHTGKLMERMPQDYLAWVQAQPWTAHWQQWQPVADYLTRFLIADDSTEWPSPVVFVGPMQACEPSKKWHYPEHALLTCHPDAWLHEDKYHTFALGALGLRPSWYDQKLKAYRLTAGKRALAIRQGAGEIASHPRRAGFQKFVRVDDHGVERCTKHCYASEHEAAAEIDRILNSRRRNRPDYLRAYECQHCAFWHLTRQKLPNES